MKALVAVSLLLAIAGCTSACVHATRPDISGTWESVSVFENGKEKPIDAQSRVRITYTNGRYEAFGPNRVGSFGQYTTTAGKGHGLIDMTGGRHTVRGIYVTENDLMKIYTSKTRPEVRPDSMDSTADTVIQTYRRIK